VGEEAALAHPDGVGEGSEREALDALDRGEAGGLAKDRLATATSVTALATVTPSEVAGDLSVHHLTS
jgi:hypothetical protein